MNTGHDHHHEPLTPEEQALAQHLSRTAPQREPSAALDARILAAARGAVAAPAAPARNASRRRPQRRWPLAMGMAATLALAVGIAWQLRPGQDGTLVYSPEPAAAPAAMEEKPAAADKAAAQPMQAEPTPAAAPPAQSQAAEPAKPVAATDAGEAADAGAGNVVDSAPIAAKREMPAPSKPSPIVFDAPSPMDTPPAPSPPPPPAPPVVPAIVAPAAAPAPSAWPDKTKASSPAGSRQDTAIGAATAAPSKQLEYKQASPQLMQARERDQVQGATSSGIANLPPAPRVQTHKQTDAESRSLDRIEVTGSRIDHFGDQPIDDQPPASADSPQVREAWLQRIRDLVSAGKLNAARDSLREYQHRYPQAKLPDDLRALLAE